jgi:protein kinase N
MLMEPCMGGELFAHLNTEVFSEERTKFYAACVVLGISHLHKKNVIYRDLKLEKCAK